MVERFPIDPLSWSTLATIAATAGEAETAERAFRTWLALAPGDADAQANYGLFLERSGRAAEGRTILEEATRDHPGHGLAWLNYATALDALGEARAADEARRKAEALMTDEQRATLLR
jgi:Tfp pilus assembly protein PilF